VCPKSSLWNLENCSQVAPVVKKTFPWRLLSLTVLIGLFTSGCGSNSQMPPTFPVRGTVMVDGKPLAEGAISFDPADGQGGVYGGPIRDGQYAVDVSVGPKRVSILGMKQLGEIGPDGKPMASQFLPRRYNAATELTASIEPQDNDLPFELSAQASANRR
jgi:hypothetical protein